MTSDWVIDPASLPWRPDDTQRELLDKLELAITSAPREDPLPAIAPIVRKLAMTGMTAHQIADHSRVRPQGVDAILGTVRAVVFDLDGVLRHFDPSVTSGIERRHGLAPGTIPAAAFGPELGRRATDGSMRRADWIHQISKMIGSVAAAMEWGSQPTRVDQRVWEIVKRIRVPVAILTNGTDTIPQELASLDLGTPITRVFNSWELGVAKPDPAIYRHVLDALGAEPHQMVFIDDTEANVRAAADLGIHAVRFTGAEALERDLTALGVPLT